MTLPSSDFEVAPVCAIICVTVARISSSLICCGKYFSMIFISVASFAASSGRLPAVNCSKESFLDLISLPMIWMTSASVASFFSFPETSNFMMAAFSMRSVSVTS